MESAMLPRLHRWWQTIKATTTHVPGASMTGSRLSEEIYQEAIGSIVPVTVDVLVFTEDQHQRPQVILGYATSGELAGKWVPFGKRMYRGDSSPQFRGKTILSSLGLEVAEQRFDIVSMHFTHWQGAHYGSLVLVINLLPGELEMMRASKKYSDLLAFSLDDALEHADVPEVYKAYLNDWRNETTR